MFVIYFDCEILMNGFKLNMEMNFVLIFVIAIKGEFEEKVVNDGGVYYVFLFVVFVEEFGCVLGDIVDFELNVCDM